jgi:uncharacterized coiled-coil DUF342 family protein
MADLRKRLSELTKELLIEVPIGTTIFLDLLSTLASRVRRENPQIRENPEPAIALREAANAVRKFDDHVREYRQLLTGLTGILMNLSDATEEDLQKKWTPELDQQIADLRAGREKLAKGARADQQEFLSFIEKRSAFLKEIDREITNAAKFIRTIGDLMKP